MNTLEQNKSVVRQYVDGFNRGDLEALRPLFTPDAMIYGVLGFGGIDQVMPIWRDLHDGMGMQLKIEEISAEGDVVAVRFTETGTFKGPFLGKPPTGKSYQVVAIEWFVLRDGKIARRWAARDSASISKQLGM